MSPQLHTIVSLLSKLVVFLCQWTARAVLLVVNVSYEALVSTSLLLLSLLVLVFLVFLSIAMAMMKMSRVTTLTLARSLSRVDSREGERDLDRSRWAMSCILVVVTGVCVRCVRCIR